ncbi:flagellar basal body-associated protein FliL [Lysinibacillus sp. NPDC096418]|uniref:flagellar basal body-associated protein FliL n=1 Tax=Lysinibacillus sp. NPDC096418 TaxID=3364138 RepID=UPI00381C5614
MKNNKLLTILLIVLVLITLVGVVLFVLFTQFNKPTSLEPSIDKVLEASVDVPEITTNLSDNKVVRFSLKITTSSKEAAEELTKRNFQTNNIVIEELSEMTQEDLEGKQGKQMFKKTLKTKLNELMQEGEVQEIYYNTFVNS